MGLNQRQRWFAMMMARGEQMLINRIASSVLVPQLTMGTGVLASQNASD